MLILTRRVGEAIRIGSDTKIIVVKIDRSRVTVGIEAPANVRVDREEIFVLRQAAARQRNS